MLGCLGLLVQALVALAIALDRVQISQPKAVGSLAQARTSNLVRVMQRVVTMAMRTAQVQVLRLGS